MGTIMSRRRKDGTTGYTAVIRIKKGGKVIRTEMQTVDRKQAAASAEETRDRAGPARGAGAQGRSVANPTLSFVPQRLLAEGSLGWFRTQAIAIHRPITPASPQRAIPARNGSNTTHP
jgi:hypothetical protein